jgi:hypothetical protein
MAAGIMIVFDLIVTMRPSLCRCRHRVLGVDQARSRHGSALTRTGTQEAIREEHGPKLTLRLSAGYTSSSFSEPSWCCRCRHAARSITALDIRRHIYRCGLG